MFETLFLLASFVAPIQSPAVPIEAAAVSGAQSTANSAFAALVPADAFAVLRLQSLDELDRAMTAFARAADKPLPFDASLLLGGMLECPGPVKQLERKQPIAIALTLPPGSTEPVPTFIVPVADAAAYLKELPVSARKWSGERSGGYLALSQLAGYVAPATPSPLALELPQGALAVRVDMLKVIEAFGGFIDMGMAEAEAGLSRQQAAGDPGAALVEPYLERVQEFLDSVLQVDLALALDGSQARLSTELRLDPDSPMGKPRAAAHTFDPRLLQRLPPDSPFRLVAHFDMPGMFDTAMEFFDTVASTLPTQGLRPEMYAQFEQLQLMVERFKGMSALFGNSLCAGYGFSSEGMTGCAVMESLDPAKLIDAYTDFFAELNAASAPLSGFAVTPLADRVVGSTTYRELRMSIDVAKLGNAPGLREMLESIYGKAGTRISIGESGPWMILGANASDESLLRAANASAANTFAVPAELVPLAGASSALWMQVDAAQMFEQSLALLPTSDRLPVDRGTFAGKHFRVSSWGGAVQSRWLGGLALDLGELESFVQGMKSTRAAAPWDATTDADEQR
jgi:hypothetical protein